MAVTSQPVAHSRTGRAKPFISTKVPLPSQRLRQVRPQPAPAPETTKRPRPTVHEYPEYDAARDAANDVSPLVTPAELHTILNVAPYVRIVFGDERKLLAFRHNLYKVNVEGQFRYATRREGWTGLVVLRLK